MNDGIFKTRRTGLLGSRRVDVQWWWAALERAKKLAKVCRPHHERQNKTTPDNQLRLPGLD